MIDWQGKNVAVVPGEWIVAIKPGAANLGAKTSVQTLVSAAATMANLPSLVLKQDLALAGLSLVQAAPEVTYDQLCAALSKVPGFAYLEPNFRVQASAMPNDPSFSQLYGLHNTGQTGGLNDADIDMPEAWDLATGNGSVIIGVIDTGVDYTHRTSQQTCGAIRGRSPVTGWTTTTTVSSTTFMGGTSPTMTATPWTITTMEHMFPGRLPLLATTTSAWSV